MNVRAFALAAAVVVMAIGPAVAQTTNPIMTHYRAYRAALEANDLAAAETAASAALAASVARDGDGGRTGVLALNLAQTRLMRGDKAGAYAPAQQASAIAGRDANAGVDPLLASLLLGRAELGSGRDREARERIMNALRNVAQREDLATDAYNAAADLGQQLTVQEDYREAAEAWSAAVRFADMQKDDHVFAEAEARIGEGIARFSLAATARVRERARPTDTRIFFDSDEELGLADVRFQEAQILLSRDAETMPADGGLTLAQRTYASALAWRRLLKAFTETYRLRTPESALSGRSGEYWTLQDGPLCETVLVDQPRPTFPAGARAAFSIGAVVVRFVVDENGAPIDTRVAASVPQRWFQESVERVAPRWRLQRAEGADPKCEFDRVTYSTMYFYFSQ